MDPTFKTMRENAMKLRIVNDTAERGIALIQAYNQSLTKDEEQKQYLLRTVHEHRKTCLEPTKGALMK
ncbi:hypothetical protein Hamer_G004019 [Homarus americanus]|uniref:Uncharacterized protein n=1 Tax=Homarus americanus TaxID=6706 RepID=A0A8J5NJQ4_HOMAM|nr:hypothetical protein Hamer_G004019 [Homarus americanus]